MLQQLQVCVKIHHEVDKRTETRAAARRGCVCLLGRKTWREAPMNTDRKIQALYISEGMWLIYHCVHNVVHAYVPLMAADTRKVM